MRQGIPRRRHMRHLRYGRLKRRPLISNFLEERVDSIGGEASGTNFTRTSANVFTANSHGLPNGVGPVVLTTTGTLPAGLSGTTRYWVRVLTANTFSLALSLENIRKGIYVSTSGAGTGTHTLKKAEDEEAFFDALRRNKAETVAAAESIDDLT